MEYFSKKTVSFGLGLLFFTSLLSANQTLTLNTTGLPPLNTPQQSGFMDLIAKEAFLRVNLELITVKLPAERGLKNSNSGIEDGEMSRVKGIEKQYPNLVRVPETIMEWQFVAFSKNDIDLSNGWKDLAQHSIAYINGWKILEKNANFKNAVRVRNSEQLFKLLTSNRTDVILYERWGGLLAKSQAKLSNAMLIQPALAKKSMYIYLHKKHAHLVDKLSAALTNMKADGTYQKIYDLTLAPLKQ